MIRVQVQDFDINAEISNLSARSGAAGAIVTFTGLVRGGSGPSDIEAIYLEHYPGMTERALQALEGQARARFDLQDVLIIHRIGQLAVGAQIVLVITISAHRQAAFDAANFLMDRLKTDAPFWKAEISAGKTHWVDMKDGDIARAERWAD
jgi:molybdopterin synthase catalytic subunit